jgi:hypothetical protein
VVKLVAQNGEAGRIVAETEGRAGITPCCRRTRRGSKASSLSSRADRPKAAYLRAAQAYMLISMPTDTSTIFGAFQAIRTSLSFCVAVRAFEIRTGIDVTQVFTASDDEM